MYFGLKFPPSPSKTKPPRYSPSLTSGTPQQTEEVQQIGRIVSLFFELLFHLEWFLLKSERHIKNKKIKFSGIQILWWRHLNRFFRYGERIWNWMQYDKGLSLNKHEPVKDVHGLQYLRRKDLLFKSPLLKHSLCWWHNVRLQCWCKQGEDLYPFDGRIKQPQRVCQAHSEVDHPQKWRSFQSVTIRTCTYWNKAPWPAAGSD